MNFSKTLVLFLFCINLSFSQTNTANDTIIATQYFKKADSLLTDKKYDESIEFFKKALPIYEQVKAWDRVAGCYNGIAENHWLNANDDDAMSNSKKALEISNKYLTKDNKEEANAYERIGNYHYYNTVLYDTTIENFKKALEIKTKIFGKNNENIARLYSRIGITDLERGNLKEALKFLLIADTMYENLGGGNSFAKVDTYTNLSRIYADKGDYEKGLMYQNKGLTMMIDIQGLNHIEVGYHYNDLVLMYLRLGKYDKASTYYKKSLSILENSPKVKTIRLAIFYSNLGGVFKEKGDYSIALKYYRKALSLANGSNDKDVNSLLFNNIGLLYNRMEEYDKALDYCQKSLSIRRQIFNKDNPHIAATLENLGYVYQKKEDFEKALNSHKSALVIFENYIGSNSHYVANSFNNVANVYAETERLDKAILNYDAALIANSIPLEVSDNKQKFNPSNYLDLEVLLLTLAGKGNVERSKYKENNKVDFLIKSATTYQKADVAISYGRQTLNNHNDKITFAKKAKDIYKGAIETHISFFDQNQNSFEKAFYYTEKSKSNTLKDLLNSANAKNFSGLSANLIRLEKELRIDKAFYQSKVNETLSNKEIDSTKLSNYENKLFDISRRQDSLTEVLEKNYPKYYELKYQNEVISVAEIQQKLQEKTTLLEFFTTDSITYAFTISKNKIEVKELATPELTVQIEKLRATITNKNTKSYKREAYQLYELLIAPIKNQLVGSELIIVPDGPLWHLNFDLLLSQEDDSNNPKELPYLLKEYTISYANSATLLFAEDKNAFDASKKQEECLAFSFSDSTNVMDTKTMSLATLRDTGDDLPGTRKEIQAIADIIDGQYYYGSEAVESNFKKNASYYNILHLALHGEVDNERPENSKLFFTKSKDTIEDNLLYSHELFALDIPAELTVLSACNTGTGKIAKGEGIMSLGTAFQYAGTKSLLLSSWEVSDQTTPELMKYFYTNLKEGMNKAKALQQAKIQYLSSANLNRTHPFYWGGFYLVGDATPIQFSNDNYLYWLIGAGILAMILLSLFWYRRRINN
ncbi:CHAT domain-containing protein [Aquimarina sp. 2201CG14-23]|uniref:CHAT domain-containing protein n=1 Tax=Aquimarina mycalae TaxID=3040073 RepID=UPI0024782753|nr:CHAT domain-containing tetratricopeptide repeat protein [Aquimarina sp. 2201CG14-23]MDH7446145.1 CHAT domain-containing protein [Aquimarina sp. 2201CG14-23]